MSSCRSGLALLGLAALALALAGAAGSTLAKRKPFTPSHRTKVTPGTQWVPSFRGSMTWEVLDDRTQTAKGATEKFHFSESSATQWILHGAAEQGATFQVIYPTPCKRFRGVPCLTFAGSAGGGGAGGKVETMYKIDDSHTDTSGKVDTIQCGGSHSDKTGMVGFGVHYVKGGDTYVFTLVGAPQLSFAPEVNCPPQPAPFDTLQDWLAPEYPGKGLTQFFKSAPVAIPAIDFATYSTITIPVSALSINGPSPHNCGLGANPQPNGFDETCAVRYSWTGTVILHRM